MFANTFLVAGEESRAQTTFWSDSVRHGQHSKKLQANSYLVQSIIHCSYGPEDNSQAVPESLMTAPAERKAANKRTGKTERGQSCKRGCLMQFTVSQLAAWPEVTRIIGRHFDHVNAAGIRCHGPEAPGVSSKLQRAKRAPHLSVKTRGWVRTLLSAGISTKEIMRKHQKRFDEDMQNGSLTRDSFLKRQDVRNLEHNLAEKVWKLHEDEATSVRLFKQQHDKNVFMYTEQQPAQPASDGQPSQPARPFVIGLVTDDMRAAALKHGHNGVVCLDATFATNHLKIPLYTGLVVDEHGNGLPIFEVLSESTTQVAVTEWMESYRQYMQTFQADWRPSCFMVDDAQGEINAIRYATVLLNLSLC